MTKLHLIMTKIYLMAFFLLKYSNKLIKNQKKKSEKNWRKEIQQTGNSWRKIVQQTGDKTTGSYWKKTVLEKNSIANYRLLEENNIADYKQDYWKKKVQQTTNYFLFFSTVSFLLSDLSTLYSFLRKLFRVGISFLEVIVYLYSQNSCK